MWWKKDSLFNKLYLENCTMTWERVKLYHWFTTYRNIYSEWNKDLNKTPNYKPPKRKHQGGKILADPLPQSKGNKATINIKNLGQCKPSTK